MYKTLKRDVLKALKLSPYPAKIILECIGEFYTQDSNAYVEGSPLIKERKAKVLLLECFLMMMGEGRVVEIENVVKEKAEQAALAWYRRLNFEGGILKAQEIDARGLLLLIGCFGIPQAFRNEDIKDLLHQSYIKMISVSLSRSSVLMPKIPEIIEDMLKENLVVDTVYFGLENRFNPRRLLTSILHESELSLLNKLTRSEQMKGSGDSVVREVIGVKRRYWCFESCHSKLLPEWEIGRKVMSLEKENAQLRKKLKGSGQKIAQKRKIDETEWLSNKEVKRSHFPNPWPPQQQRVVNHVDSNNTLLESGGTAGHIYGHSV
ncbi:protein FRIGIDA-like [Lycium barbarum]|uniref:protein FRIGIDA-like n=1 Tax=Lycium barbarum TaxID=112863 RepID=UPI00293F4088|nr:protein FRIGIDA-like [Lycium barbarum]